MNKLPAKQIYLLSIIVFGIIALSVYSTYAIFTYEASTSDILSINTPNSLSFNESTTKYKQITVPSDSYVTTDIDIYNNYNYDVCYSVWYKTLNDEDNTNLKIYENTTESLTTSGVITPVTSNRVNILLINDSKNPIKVKLGLSYAENTSACELNMTSDKKQITSTINSENSLYNVLISSQDKNSEAGYLTYKNMTSEITIPTTESVMIGSSFDYNDELFTLKNPITINNSNIEEYLITNSETKYYTCLSSDNCKKLYKINKVTNNNNEYSLTEYDILEGYTSGISGIRKVDNNYYFYGDNPNNFIYYNCSNEMDTKTCELWRIIGLKYDETEQKYLTKIIRNDYLIKSSFSTSQLEWSKSNINEYLNKEYKLKNDISIKEVNIKQENITDMKTKLNDITNYGNSFNSKINIMSLSDYLNASTCTNREIESYNETCLNNNWLNKNNESEWTMSVNYVEPIKDEETDEITTEGISKIYSVSSKIESLDVTHELYLRPTAYLKNRMFVISGDGSIDNPYVIR